jgi:hypothetical protein
MKIPLLVAIVALGSSLGAQEVAPLLPASSRARAIKLLDSMDRSTKSADGKRRSTWKAENEAQAAAIQAYAVLAATRAGGKPWASRDGSMKAAEASAALTEARDRAKKLARSLASGEDGSAVYLKARDEAAKSLSSLIRSSGIGPKSATALARRLAAKANAARLFPETAEIIELLNKQGAEGAREAAAAAARGSAESVAFAFLDVKARIRALSPESDAPLARLESAARAYRGWMETFPEAAFLGDAIAATSSGSSPVSQSISAMALLGEERLRALFEAMAKGDGRDAAAAYAGKTLSEAWQRSPEPRRKAIASFYGLPESTMATFCFALAERKSPEKPLPAVDPLVVMRALNTLEAELSEEAEAKGGARGPEPSLLFLERPDMAEVAKNDGRYSKLYAETQVRLDAIYARAAEEASARIESAPSLVAAASRALGSAPAALSVRSVELLRRSGEAGRRLAFEAMASDPSGNSVNLPIDEETAGRIYAATFAKAADLGASRVNSAALLERYGQTVVSAFAPSICQDRLEIGAFPAREREKILNAIDMELAMLGGWRP